MKKFFKKKNGLRFLDLMCYVYLCFRVWWCMSKACLAQVYRQLSVTQVRNSTVIGGDPPCASVIISAKISSNCPDDTP